MTRQEIDKFNSKIIRYIDSRRLRDAITALKDMAHRRMAWEIGDKIEQTEKSYAYMLSYLSQGAKDPERDMVYESIIAQLYAELDALTFYMEKSENPSQYFSTVRLFERGPVNGLIPKLLDAITEKADKMSLFSIIAEGQSSDQAQSQHSDMESLQSDLFVSIWATPVLSTTDQDAISAALGNDNLPPQLKQQIVSAVTMGLWQIYDPKRLAVLMDAYMSSSDIKVSSAALTGMLLGLWKYSNRPLLKPLADRLAAVKEMPSWPSDLRIATIELIRTRDTERINRKIQDEIVPDMLKLKPEIMERMKNEDIEVIDLSEMQENPEWQELLDRNGIADKLKEMTEAQLEGADVMMSTFAHLKSFPFFNDIANWFLPFDINHSQIQKSVDKAGVVADMIDHAQFLCDNDKYSFMLAIDMVPEQQREMMSQQFKAQSESIYEAMGDAKVQVSSEARRRSVNLYLQNIYRFFKLYRRRGEFYDPFDQGVNLIAVKALADDFNDEEMLQVVAEFYFKLGYYQDALDVFERLEEMMPGDAQRYQKMGFSQEKLGFYEPAIEYYQRAELLDAQSYWTTKRLAVCYKCIGENDKAAEYYRMLAESNPDDMNAALMYGYMLLEDKDYKSALHQFYRMEFIDEQSHKPWRPLAWTLFLTGDFDGAARYYDKIANDYPTANDYLNMGHLALAQGNMRDAINEYRLSLQNNSEGVEGFIRAINNDRADLQRVGIAPNLIPLIIDAVLYSR